MSAPPSADPTRNRGTTSVLVVEDNGDDYFLIADLLGASHGLVPHWEDSLEGGLEKLREGGFDVVLLDFGLGANTGIDFLQEAKACGSRAPIIMVTGRRDRDIDLAAMASGAEDYLVKGEFGADLLERSIRYAIERKRAREALRECSRQRTRLEARAQLEAQRSQFERLNSVATLACGIAHDFNNTLASILMHGEAIAGELPAGDPVRPHVQEVIAAAERAGALIQQLRAFTRSVESDRVSVPLGPAIDDAMASLAVSLPAGVRLESEIAPGCREVSADPNKIQQLLVQVGANAAQALAGGRGGTISFRLRELTPDVELRRRHPALQERAYAVISVEDDGAGMDAVTRRHVFEPFFSSRGVGRSGGLGLSVAYGIVTGLGGEITVESELGKGTTFAIYLPLVRGETAPGWIHESSGAGRSGTAAAAPSTVMVVDDDLSIAGATAQILEHYGYTTETFANSIQALEAIRANPCIWDLLITDQRMPVLSGLQLARAVQDLRADLPVIMTSGFESSLPAEQLSAYGVRAFIPKPFSRQVLIDTVKSTLAA